MSTLSEAHKGALALLGTGFVFGTFGPIFRVLSSSFSPYEIYLWQFGIGTGVIMLYVLIKKMSISIQGVSPLKLLAFAFSFPLGAIAFGLAIMYAKVTTITFLYYALAFITSYVISVVFLKEQTGTAKIVALLLSIIGIGVYALPVDMHASLMGYVFVVIAVASVTLSSTYRRSISSALAEGTLLLAPLLAGLVISVVLVLLFPSIQTRSATQYSLSHIVLLLVMGLRIHLINWSMLYGFKRVDLNVGTLLISSDLVIATILSVVLLHESFSFKELLGAGIILLGILVANWPKKAYVKT